MIVIKNDAQIDRKQFRQDLLKNVPDLFVRDCKGLFYSLEKPRKNNRKINPITNYEVRLKIVCHPHKNDFNIDKDLFLVPFLIM